MISCLPREGHKNFTTLQSNSISCKASMTDATKQFKDFPNVYSFHGTPCKRMEWSGCPFQML